MNDSRNWPERSPEDAILNLAAAIVREAVADYRDALMDWFLMGKRYLGRVKELEDWFDSDWANLLTLGNAELVKVETYKEVWRAYNK